MGGNDRGVSPFQQKVEDAATLVFRLSLVAVVLLFGYMLYMLLSGRLAEVASQPHAQRQQALDTITSLSGFLNLGLIVMLVSGAILFWAEAAFGYGLLAVAAFLAYGLHYVMEFFQSRDYTAGSSAQAAMKEMHLASLLLGVPAIALVVVAMGRRIMEGREGADLTAVQYGKDAKAEQRPQALIGAFAKCWQLPFCRDGIRKTCPIYHARTKCWKQRVGCMCEENIIRLATAGEVHPAAGTDLTKEQALQKGSGFVAIGDLIQKSDSEQSKHIPTKVGPRGVRIPTNPHLSEGQKAERCRNCVIYNEHQRQKYQLLSPVATIAVPLLVFLQFETLRGMLARALVFLDTVIGRLTFSGPDTSSFVASRITGSVPIETILIIAITLVLMTWALRFLEYCMFKIKI